MKKPSPAEAVKAGQQASQLSNGSAALVMERDILLQTPSGVEVHKVRQTPLLGRMNSLFVPPSTVRGFHGQPPLYDRPLSRSRFLEATQVLTAAAVGQVEGEKEELMARAPLVCYAVVYPTGERRMACEVAEVRWWLLTTTATLKVAPLTYVVALPGERVFYSVTFAEDTTPEVRLSHPAHNAVTTVEAIATR